MISRAERWAVSILAALMGMGLIGIVATFSQSNSNGNSLTGVHNRLDALENNRATATARRWTADDQMEFITCLDHPNFTQERRACIHRIKARFQAAQQP
jgi:hypothetical protein